jgi:hypothetical protein
MKVQAGAAELAERRTGGPHERRITDQSVNTDVLQEDLEDG